MPRKGQRLKTRQPSALKPRGSAKRVHDPLGHNGLVAYLEAHFEWLLVTGYSADTVRARRVATRRFIAWCDERGLTSPQAITPAILERYQRHLFYYRKADGAPLSIGAQLGYLAPLKTWFKWLAREHHILYSPAAALETPREPHALPRTVLSIPEVEAILAQAAPGTPYGLRDRAMLEVLYSCGLRRMELVGLATYDIDFARAVVRVREGKGRRDRVVPIGARALAWVDKYLLEARPQLLTQEIAALFVSDYGEPVSPARLAHQVKRYMAFAGIHKPGAAHLFRHACATHMLDGGADIRFIQALLGHAQLSTTEIYTHVSIEKLKAIHAATHPARLTRPATMAGESTGVIVQTLLAADADDDAADAVPA